MYYSIKGGLKKERELVIKALWFAKDYLLPRHTFESVIEYNKHIHKLLEDGNNEALLAHLYVRHFGDLHGGQMIARRGPGEGHYYKFNGQEKELITKVRTRREGKEEVYVDEAIKCFEFATQLFKELSGE